MTKSLTPPPHLVSYQTQVQRYQDVSTRLLVALDAQGRAKATHDNARDTYEDRRRELIINGIPGCKERCPGDEREAYIARALAQELRQVRVTREELRAADTLLESVRVQERAERETLRSIQRDWEFHANAKAQAI